MAKLSPDFINFTLTLNSGQAQQEIHKLEQATKGLKTDNKELRKAMNDLIATGKRNSDDYRRLEAAYKANSKAIGENDAKISHLLSTIDKGSKSYSQLAKEAKSLQRQLDNTVKTLDPESYERINRELEETKNRMSELRAKSQEVQNVWRRFDKLKTVLSGMVAQFGYNITNFLTNAITGSVARMRQFASEAIDMATKADGVTNAFRKLDDGKILDNLRRATKGTVNDLELMKSIVQAKDFRIPLEDMGKYLAFAQLKAQQTGQSVDYMTQSIVTGLGRKSLMILDNLGLSAAEINEEVKRTGDFMKGVSAIVDRQLQQSGQYVSASDKAASAQARLQNAQLKLGQALSWVGDVQLKLTELTARFAEAVTAAFSHKGVAAVKSLGAAIASVATAYATYRAAMFSVIAVRRVSNALLAQAVVEKRLAAAAGITLSNAEAVAAARTKLLAAAQQGLVKAIRTATLALLKNPYVIATAAVAALTVGIYKLVTAEDASVTGARRANEQLKAQAGYFASMKAEAQSAADTLTRMTNGTEARYLAYLKLRKLMPEVLKDLDWENARLLTNAELQGRIADEALRRERIGIKTKIVMAQNRINTASRIIDMSANPGSGITPFAVSRQESEKKAAQAELETYRKQLAGLEAAKGEAVKESAQAEVKNKEYWEKYKSDYQEKLDKLDSNQRNAAKWKEYVAEIRKAEAEIAKYSARMEKPGKTPETKEPKATDAGKETAKKSFMDVVSDEFRSWNGYLKQYGTVKQKQYAISLEYDAKIREASTAGQKAMLEEQKKQLIDQLNVDRLKEEINWEAVFGDLSKVSKESLTKVRAQLRQFRESKEYKNMGVEQKKVVDEALARIEDTVVNRGGLLGGLPEELKRLADASDELEAAQRAYDKALKEGTEAQKEEARKRLNTAERNKQNQQANVDKASRTATDNMLRLADSITQLGKSGEMSLSQIGGIAASITDIFAEAGSKIGGIIGSTFSLMDAVQKQGLDGLIGNILKNFVRVQANNWNLLLGWTGISFDGESDKNLQKDIERLSQSNEYLIQAIDRLGEKMDDSPLAGVSSIYEEQKELLEESRKNTAEMMQRSAAAYSNGFMGMGGSHSSAKKVNDGMSAAMWQRISEVAGVSVKNASGFFALTSEQMNRVRENAADLYGRIKALADDGYKDAAQYMDQYTDYYRQLLELEDAYAEKLTSTSFDSVVDDFRSALLDMNSSADDFTKNFSKMMQKAVVEGMLADTYRQKLKEWYNGFRDAMENGELTAAEQTDLKEEWNSIVNAAIEERNALRDAMGWNTDGNATDQNTTRGGYATASQDSIDELSGRVTAMTESNIRLETFAASIASQSVLQLECATEIRDILHECNDRLERIVRNTAPIARTSELLEEVSAKL